MNVSEILQWVGVAASLIGVGIAILQITRARKAAEAAEEAATKAHKAVTRIVFVSDVAGIREATESVSTYLTSGKYDVALLRVRDLIHQLTQLQRMPPSKDTALPYRELLVNLRLIRSDLEDREVDPTGKVDMARMLKYLSAIADELSGAIGQVKYQREEDKG